MTLVSAVCHYSLKRPSLSRQSDQVACQCSLVSQPCLGQVPRSHKDGAADRRSLPLQSTSTDKTNAHFNKQARSTASAVSPASLQEMNVSADKPAQLPLQSHQQAFVLDKSREPPERTKKRGSPDIAKSKKTWRRSRFPTGRSLCQRATTDSHPIPCTRSLLQCNEAVATERAKDHWSQPPSEPTTIGAHTQKPRSKNHDQSRKRQPYSTSSDQVEIGRDNPGEPKDDWQKPQTSKAKNRLLKKQDEFPQVDQVENPRKKCSPETFSDEISPERVSRRTLSPLDIPPSKTSPGQDPEEKTSAGKSLTKDTLPKGTLPKGPRPPDCCAQRRPPDGSDLPCEKSSTPHDNSDLPLDILVATEQPKPKKQREAKCVPPDLLKSETPGTAPSASHPTARMP